MIRFVREGEDDGRKKRKGKGRDFSCWGMASPQEQERQERLTRSAWSIRELERDYCVRPLGCLGLERERWVIDLEWE